VGDGDEPSAVSMWTLDVELLDRDGREDRCEAALVASLWPQGLACPACGVGVHSVFVRTVRRLRLRRLPPPMWCRQRHDL